LILCALPEETDTFFLLSFARDQLKRALHHNLQSIGLMFVEASLDEQLADSFGAALSTRLHLMPTYGKRAKEQKKFKLSQVSLFAQKNILKAFQFGLETGEGTN